MQQPPLMANLADRPEQPRKWNARRFRINAAQISRSKTLTKGFPSEGNPTHHLKRMAELNFKCQSKALLFSPLYPYWPLSPTQSAPILLCRCRISIKYQWKLTVSNMADLPALFEYTKKKIENVHPLLQQQQSSWGLFFHRNHSHILQPVISVLQENSLSVLHFFIKFSFFCFCRRKTGVCVLRRSWSLRHRGCSLLPLRINPMRRNWGWYPSWMELYVVQKLWWSKVAWLEVERCSVEWLWLWPLANGSVLNVVFVFHWPIYFQWDPYFFNQLYN